MEAEAVRKKTFRTSFGGYQPSAVDALLWRIARQLDSGQPLDIKPVLPTSFRGYSRAAVEDFLAQLGLTVTEADKAQTSDQGDGSFDPLILDAGLSSWLREPERGFRFDVRVSPVGVTEVDRFATLPRQSPLLWAVGWIVHLVAYRGRWEVAVWEATGGSILPTPMTNGIASSPLFRQKYNSRQAAEQARQHLLSRIQTNLGSDRFTI